MKLLDLFCGAGGAAMGYYRAGFTEIVGIDVQPQPRYPFVFVQGDALRPPVDLQSFDAIHASPPCQGYSWTSHIHHCQTRPYPKLVELTRKLLRQTGKPYVIENVVGAPLNRPVTLCGTMFGLPLRRHRLFESSHPLSLTPDCSHGADYGVYAGKVTRIGTRAAAYVAGSGRIHYRPKTAGCLDGQRAMGIDWMTLNEMAQAIPPAYTEWVGKQLKAYVTTTLE